MDTIMLNWALPSKIRCTMSEHGQDTAELLWRITLWDMHCCFEGAFPETDWNGEEFPEDHPRRRKSGRICGPFFMAWFQWASDDEYLANYLRLPHWNNPRPCIFCPCNITDNPWTDFRPTARWQQELKTLAQFEANPPPHPLWQAWGTIGLTTFHICIDELHNGALGILKHSLASTIWVFVHFANVPGRFSTRVSTVWARLSTCYDELGVDHRLRIPYFKFLAVFGRQVGSVPSDWPVLSCKAAAARHLLVALARVCAHLAQEFQVDTIEFRLIRLLLDSLVEFYETLTAHGHHMPSVAGEACLRHMRQALQAQNALGQHYRNLDTPVRLFHITFKSHLMWHLADNCKFFNPRCGWCYRDESFVGRIAKIARSVVAGLGSLKVALSVAKKWRYVLHLRIWQRDHGV